MEGPSSAAATQGQPSQAEGWQEGWSSHCEAACRAAGAVTDLQLGQPCPLWGDVDGMRDKSLSRETRRGAGSTLILAASGKLKP